ncbi:MAG: hypothetical protein Q8K99_04550 [Actinomycetota bacterium]|nr:hypothetical protein [Actinomycetota bacterium]
MVEDTVTVSFAIGARRLSRETTLAEVASLLAHVPQLEHVERLSGLGRKVTQRLLGLTAAYLVVCVPIAFVLATIIKQNVADPLLIPTAHLSPTIAAGERIIAYLGPGHGAMVCEGRVVIRQVEGNPPIKISEWVLAEGPAVVHVSEDGAVRDGQPLTLPWNVGDNSDELTYTIPARSVLVGNRMSTGLYVLPVEEVNGVGVAVYYPLNRMRSLLDVGEANPQ